jgi:hypothetical protein
MTPYSLVYITNGLEADCASIFGLAVKENYIKYGFKKEIQMRKESFLLPLFKQHLRVQTFS